MRHVVYADVDEDGHVRYVGKGTRSRYHDPERSYWGRTAWRPARRIILYRAGSDEAVRVLESVAIEQHLEAGADLLNARRPSIPDLAAAAESRRRADQLRIRREKEARKARRLARAQRRAQAEERERLGREFLAEQNRLLAELDLRRSEEAAASMERLRLLWDRRDAGLEADVGRGLTERAWCLRNPFRKIEAAHLRAVGRETRSEYRQARNFRGRRRGFRTAPTRIQLATAEAIAMLKTLPGLVAAVSLVLVSALVLLLWWTGVV